MPVVEHLGSSFVCKTEFICLVVIMLNKLLLNVAVPFDRCDSCHGQAEKLLDAAKEMEDSIGVNLRFVFQCRSL